MSRIGSGRRELDLEVEDLSVIIQEVLRTYQLLVARNGNVLELARGGAHPQVLVDRERVAQVLVNLLTNAARHTSEGTISVTVRERGEFAQVMVSDTGEGIPADVQSHLFERIGRPSFTGIRSVPSGGEATHDRAILGERGQEDDRGGHRLAQLSAAQRRGRSRSRRAGARPGAPGRAAVRTRRRVRL